jgi:hypothetical protein
MSSLVRASELWNVRLQHTDFLLVCSERSLNDFELARLNTAANLRKQIRELETELLKMEAEALVARWLIERRHELEALCHTRGGLQKAFQFSNGAGM